MNVGPLSITSLLSVCVFLALAARAAYNNDGASRPENVSVVRESNTSVSIHWNITNKYGTRFQIAYRPINASDKNSMEVSVEVNNGSQMVVLNRLLPSTKYMVYVSAINGEKRNNSEPVQFQTKPQRKIKGKKVTTVYVAGEFRVRGEEIGIVLVVFLVWVSAVALFFNRWGKIRMLEPYQPNFKHTNLSLNNSLQVMSRSCRDNVTFDLNKSRARSLEDCVGPNTTTVIMDSTEHLGSLEASRRVKSAIDIAAMFVYGPDTKTPSREEQKIRLSDLMEASRATNGPNICLEIEDEAL